MAQITKHEARFGELDNRLQTDDNEDVLSVRGGESLRPWYSRLLSALALLTKGSSIEYAEAILEETSGDFVIFTDKHVILAVIEDINDDRAEPVASVVPRSAIRSLALASSAKHNPRGSESLLWPGDLWVRAQYEGLSRPVIMTGRSYDQWSEDHVGDTVTCSMRCVATSTRRVRPPDDRPTRADRQHRHPRWHARSHRRRMVAGDRGRTSEARRAEGQR